MIKLKSTNCKIIEIQAKEINQDNSNYELSFYVYRDHATIYINTVGTLDRIFSLEEVEIETLRTLRDFLNYAIPDEE